MEIKCESCGNTNWKIALREVKIMRMAPSVILTVLICEGCGMMYPLYTAGSRTSVEQIEELMRKHV
ncbi:MAG: hypothetical protein ACFFF4_16565 [Candidatus Thorarchaeota archaeon]